MNCFVIIIVSCFVLFLFKKRKPLLKKKTRFPLATILDNQWETRCSSEKIQTSAKSLNFEIFKVSTKTSSSWMH